MTHTVAPASRADGSPLPARTRLRRLLATLRRSVRALLVPAARRAVAGDGAGDPPAASPRALVVEADAAAREALGAALSARGLRVATVSGAEDAVRRMSDEVEGFDVLLAGPAAAACDGDLLVRTVRRGGEADLAVVVVNAGTLPDAALERAGADAVLDGSLGAELIARATEAVLSRKRQHRRA